MNSSFPLQAVGLMLIAMTLVPSGDAAGKLLAANHEATPLFVAWSRFLIGAIFFLFLMRPSDIQLNLFKDWRIWFRSLLVICAISSILTALKTEPMANVFGAFFVGPILAYFLSAFFLKEEITLRRTILLMIGFCGVLLVVKPSASLSAGMMFGLLAGTFYGSFLVASRWLAPVASGRMMVLSQLTIGALILTPFGAPAMPAITMDVTILVLISAIGSALGNFFLILANQKMEASKLAPLVYIQLVVATILGLVIFGTKPDLSALIGIALLLASGFASLFLKSKAK